MKQDDNINDSDNNAGINDSGASESANHMRINGLKSDSVDYKQLSSYDDNLNVSSRTIRNSGEKDDDTVDSDEDSFPDSTTDSKDQSLDDYDGEQQGDDSATELNYGNDDSRVLTSSSDDFFDEDDDYDDEEYDDEDGGKDKPDVKSVSESRLEAGDQQHTSFASEEGSGGYESVYKKFRSNLYNNRFRLDLLDKYKNKHQKQQHKLLIDDDDEDSGGQDDGKNDGEGDSEDGDNRGVEGSGKFINDDEDDDDSFFSSKRKSSGRYFRKNSNDAIKIISTPNGKVGIVYQQTDVEKEPTSHHGNKHHILPSVVSSNQDRKTPIQKITPVLTPDGKVALLYRGASENTKYEPILNLSHTFNFDNKSNSVNNFKSDFDDSEEELETSLPITIPPIEETTTASTLAPPKEFENSILPSINRPLSEVLGIKKNQFKQFRIKDLPTSSTTPEPNVALATTVDLSRYINTGQPRNHNFGFDMTEYDDLNQRNNHLTPPRSSDIRMSDSSLMEPTKTTAELIAKSEVVNLAIIPHFDENFERQQRFHEPEIRRQRHRQRHRHRHINQDLSNIHCIMQAMMGVAAVSTVFGMLGALFKQRILDQIRLMHW